MKISQYRFSDGANDTLSLWFIDGKFSCFILEDEKREVKIKGETRIPAGTYRILLRKEGGHHESYLKKFPDFHKGMLWLQDVPNFQYILIHIGNVEKDTDGCLIVGNSVSQNITDKGSLQGSTDAYKRVYPIIANELEKGNVVTIEIFDSIIK